MIFQRTTSGEQQTTNLYVYGLDLSQSIQGAGTIGGILLGIFNGTSAFYAYDGNGNATELVATNGSLAAHYEYDPYGNTIAQSGSLADANPFRFSTKYLDQETGLYYYGRRYYSPTLGRWLSRDPITKLGCPLYHYTSNNPIDLTDPLGLWTLDFQGTWTTDQMLKMWDTFVEVDDRVPPLLDEITTGIEHAKALPVCCAHRLVLLTELEDLKVRVEKIKTDLDNADHLPVYLADLGSDVSAEVPASLSVLLFGPKITININSANDFFSSAEYETSSGKILHELSHLSAFTKDPPSVERWADDGMKYQVELISENAWQENLRIWAVGEAGGALGTAGPGGTLSPGAGVKGCPKAPSQWPDNPTPYDGSPCY